MAHAAFGLINSTPHSGLIANDADAAACSPTWPRRAGSRMRARVVAPLVAALIGIAGGTVTALVTVDAAGRSGRAGRDRRPARLGIPMVRLACTRPGRGRPRLRRHLAAPAPAIADNPGGDLTYLETARVVRHDLRSRAAEASRRRTPWSSGPYDDLEEPCTLRMDPGTTAATSSPRCAPATQISVKCVCVLPDSAAGPTLTLGMTPDRRRTAVWIRSLQQMFVDFDADSLHREAWSPGSTTSRPRAAVRDVPGDARAPSTTPATVDQSHVAAPHGPPLPASTTSRAGAPTRAAGRSTAAAARRAAAASASSATQRRRPGRLSSGSSDRPDVERGVCSCSRASRSSRGQPAQVEEHQRVGLDQPGQLVEHGQRVRARVRPRVAGAVAAELGAERQQLDAGLLGVLDQGVRQVARTAARRSGRPRRPRSRPARRRASSSSSGSVPATVQRPRRVLDRRHEPAGLHHDLADLTGPGHPAAEQQVGLGVRRLLDGAHPGPAPPRPGPRLLRRAARTGGGRRSFTPSGPSRAGGPRRGAASPGRAARRRSAR